MNIYKACASGNITAIKELIESHGIDILNKKTQKKQAVPLFFAVNHIQLDVVKLILGQTDRSKEFHIDIYATTVTKDTILHVATDAYEYAKTDDKEKHCLEIIKQIMLYEARLRAERPELYKGRAYLKDMRAESGLKPFDVITSYTKRKAIDGVIKEIQQEYPPYLSSSSSFSKLVTGLLSIFSGNNSSQSQQEDKQSLLANSHHIKYE